MSTTQTPLKDLLNVDTGMRVLTKEQQELEEQYLYVEKFLIEFGYKARYVRFFVWEKDQPIGYIQLNAEGE